MAELTTTPGERGAPLARLCMALITTLMGFCVSVVGFVVDDASMTVTGMFAVPRLDRGQWAGKGGGPSASARLGTAVTVAPSGHH